MQGTYHLLSLGVFSVILYLFTWLLVKTGLITIAFHRKIWIVILLTTFLVSGILGIMLVIQVNYKLEWPFMKPLMVWHVDTGIVMTIVGIFHALWHIKYFGSLFGANPRKKFRGKYPPEIEKRIFPSDLSRGTVFQLPTYNKLEIPIISAGMFATIVQVLFIREITTVFQGNELMIGSTLGIWMLLTGAGSRLGRNFRPAGLDSLIIRLLLLLSWIPPVIVLLMTFTRNWAFPPGELIDLFWFLLIILLLTAPVCLLSGLTFSLFVRATDTGEKKFAAVYLLEAVGSVAGGLLVSFVFVNWFNIMQSLMLTALIMHLLIWLTWRKGHDITSPDGMHRAASDQEEVFISTGGRQTKTWTKGQVFISTIALLLLAVATFIFPADRWLKSALFVRQHIVESRETPYGNITVTENGGEYSIFENGTLLFSTGDIILNEEFVHYAMLQHSNPAHVLLVSGGISGMTGEIVKYPEVKSVDAVEVNPALIPIVAPYRPLHPDPRISVIKGDGRRFIQHTEKRYDVVIMAVPDPSNLQVNRYYTTEFLILLKKVLNKGGVVIFGVSPSGNYLSHAKIKMEATIFQTLKARFDYVTIIPGERDYFIVSDSPVSGNIGELSAALNIPNEYVIPGYMDDLSAIQRAALIRERLEQGSDLNSDRQPLPVFYATLRDISRFSGRSSAWMLLPILLLLLPILATDRASAGMYVTGFTASSLEILLIFWFQTAFGNVYAAIGLIFALFMGGLALGSAFGMHTKTDRKQLFAGQGLLALYMLLLPLLWKVYNLSLHGFFLWLIFIPVLLFPAVLTGYLFVVITSHHPADRPGAAATVYAADLWGSALGAILISMLLLPILGITASCLAIAGLNLLIMLFYLTGKQS